VSAGEGIKNDTFPSCAHIVLPPVIELFCDTPLHRIHLEPLVPLLAARMWPDSPPERLAAVVRAEASRFTLSHFDEWSQRDGEASP
jgi:hypothetical protein